MTGAEAITVASPMWQHHPDGLALLAGGDVARPNQRRLTISAVNPALERLFDNRELVGHSAALLVPSVRLTTTNDRAEVFPARRLDGTSFPVTSSLVELGDPDDLSMLVVRDVTAIMAWRKDIPALGNPQLDQVERRERALEAQREKLAQHLFAAGLALRLCDDAHTTDVGRHDLQRTLEVLDQLMNDLITGVWL